MTDSAPQPAADAAPPKKKKGDLIPRVITSVVALPVLLGIVFAGPPWALGLVIVAAAAIGMWEFNHMLQQDEPPAVTIVSAGIGTVFVASVYLFVGRGAPVDVGEHELTVLFAGLAFVTWAGFLYNMMRKREIPLAATTVASTLSAVLYVGLPFIFVALFKRDFGADGPGLVLMVLAMCWMSDTGAYFTGRALGKHKIAPVVSPKKTIEGALGGLAWTIGAAFIVRWLFLPWMGVVDTLIVAIVGNVLGQTGDLCESLIKRSVGVKDSGTIIYGHGGMLDRVDAVLFVAPWLYLYALLADGGVIIG